MQAAIGIFLNGIFGVFVGLAVLYVAIRLIGLTSSQEPDKKEK